MTSMRERFRAPASPIVRFIQRFQYAQNRKRRYGPGPRALSAVRKWRLLLTHPHANIQFLGPVYIGPGFSLHIPGPGAFVIGPNVEFRRDFRAEIEGEGTIRVGADTSFTYGVVMQCTQGISVGSGCALARGVTIVDGQHRFRDASLPIGDQGYDWHPIQIGDDCWLGANCSVMASMGDRVVVGANSVVTRDLPSFTVAVGAPAEVVDAFGPGQRSELGTRGGEN